MLEWIRCLWRRLMAFRQHCHEEADRMGVDQTGRYPAPPPGEWLD